MVFPVVGGTQDTSYEIENSLRTGGGDNHHLSMVYSSSASDANRRKFTFSGWIKLGQAAHFTEYYDDEKYLLTSTDAAVSTTHIGYGGYTSGNAGGFFLGDGRSGTYIETTTKFRDPSAWYHLVVKYDSTQGTASDRIFIYVNGESQGLNYSNTGDPEVDLNTTVDFFLAGDNVDATSADSGNFVHNINSYMNSGFGAINNSFDGYMADWYLLDGQALAPTEFAETNDNGVWVPKKYTGTFNSHSFHLEFKQTGSSANSSGIGADTSGQDNHFKVGVNSTLAAVDITTDTPTNNFATLNPLNIRLGKGITFSEGNTQIQTGTTGGTVGGFSTIAGLKSGKWYAEFKPTVVGTNATMRFGIEDTDFNAADGLCNVAASAYASNGNKGRNATDTSHGDSYDDDDIIGVAVDLDNGAIYFSKNGTWQNSSDPESGSSKTGAAYTDILTILPTGGYMFAFNFVYNNSQQENVQANFGNPCNTISSGNADGNGYGNFEYAVPSGYYSLCTKNLAEFG
tara:strand:- start:361 stop:1896 length:1536 start_codon:yes stop_codon:yes gene_type:complete